MESMTILPIINSLTVGVFPNLILLGFIFLALKFSFNSLGCFKKFRTKYSLLSISFLSLVFFHLLCYVPGKFYFNSVCTEVGRHYISEKTIVDSVYIPGYISQTYSLTNTLLLDENVKNFLFEKIEFLKNENFNSEHDIATPHALFKGKSFAYMDSKIEAIPPKFYGVISSKYALDIKEVHRYFGVTGHVKKIFETNTKKIIAQASTINFDGGFFSWIFRPNFKEQNCFNESLSSSIYFYDYLPFIVLRGYPEKNLKY
jgi:hypothetical protein